nr:hypothetical protein [Streptomyces sp. S1D4-11]QIZ01297.1 hypothetical protein HEP87_56360 [Streptomyces sp. S1D4-11]
MRWAWWRPVRRTPKQPGWGEVIGVPFYLPGCSVWAAARTAAAVSAVSRRRPPPAGGDGARADRAAPREQGEDVVDGHALKDEAGSQEREDGDAGDLRGREHPRGGAGGLGLGRARAGVVCGHDGMVLLTGGPAAGPWTGSGGRA